MENILHNAAKYMVGVVVFLVMLALYFFVLADNTNSFDTDYVQQVIDENKSLSVNVKELEQKNADYVAQITTLEAEVADKQTVIEQLQNAESMQELNAQCDALPPSEEVLAIQNKLIDTQSNYIACASALDEKSRLAEQLANTNKAMESDMTELQASYEVAKAAEADLVIAKENNAALTAQVSDLESEQVRLKDRLEKAGPLRFTKFDVVTNFCEKDFGNKLACIDSIEILATFNFDPNARMSVKLIDPNGDIIARKPVTGRSQNRIEFTTDDDKRFLLGDYRVEFRISDYFEKTEGFTLDLFASTTL